jgi:uncharacterized protein (DUF488 family)
MHTAPFASALDRLAEDARRQPTAFMCAEARWTNCHRRMIADALVMMGVDVVHLNEPGTSEPHRLDPMLRIVDGCLVYDGSDRVQGRFELG